MFKTKKILKGFFLILFITYFGNAGVYSEEKDISETLEKIQGDIKTLEKAVYNSHSLSQTSNSLSNNDEDAKIELKDQAISFDDSKLQTALAISTIEVS